MPTCLYQDILKYTERAGESTDSLKKALHVMCVVPKAANDMMQVGRLQGFDVSFHVPLTDVFPYDSFPVLVLLNVLSYAL